MKNRILRYLILRKYRFILILLDIILLNTGLYICHLFFNLPLASLSFFITVTFIWITVAFILLLYSVARYAIRQIVLGVILSWTLMNLSVLYLDILTVGRKPLLLFLPVMGILIFGHRMVLRKLRSRRIKEKKKEGLRILILGTGSEAKKIADKIRDTYDTQELKVVGFLYPEEEIGHKHNVEIDNNLILGDINDLYRIVRKENVDQVIIAFSVYTPLLHRKILRTMNEHSELDIKFKISSYLYNSLIGRIKVRYLPDFYLLDAHPEHLTSRYLAYKRILDILLSFFGLLVLLPVFIVIGLILKFQGRGCVFYKQERLGRDGKPFILYKFRSMVPNAEEDTGPVWAGESDTRVTSFGRFLRRNSLDELPQLWNVFKGDVSLVGPRPERPHFVNKHKELRGKRLNVKPGITGLAQVNGRYNLTARHKAKYDYIYLKNCSVWLDLKILFQTFWVVLRKEGVR